MKDGLKYVIGKRIVGVVVASSEGRAPKQQVFLVFSDGTRFEFWGEHFSCCGGLDRAFGIAEYIKDGGAEIKAVYKDVVKGGPTPAAVKAGLPLKAPQFRGRELAAWRAAAAVIQAAARQRL